MESGKISLRVNPDSMNALSSDYREDVVSTPRFDLLPTPLNGVIIVERKPIKDTRGFFARFYCADELRGAGIHKPITQINNSFTRKSGVVRGLHFQYPPYAETKLISCLRGEIFDVAVDLRHESPSFLCWHGEVISAENQRSLLIPEGFAHGFQTLTNDCELIYLHTTPYHPEAEGALNPNDPCLAIKWPLTISELSDRDARHPFINKDFIGISL